MLSSALNWVLNPHGIAYVAEWTQRLLTWASTPELGLEAFQAYPNLQQSSVCSYRCIVTARYSFYCKRGVTWAEKEEGRLHRLKNKLLPAMDFRTPKTLSHTLVSVLQRRHTRCKSDARRAARGSAFLCRRKERGLTLLERLVLFEFTWQIFHIIKLVSRFIFQYFLGGWKYFFEAIRYTRYHLHPAPSRKNPRSKWPLFLSLFNWKNVFYRVGGQVHAVPLA